MKTGEAGGAPMKMHKLRFIRFSAEAGAPFEDWCRKQNQLDSNMINALSQISYYQYSNLYPNNQTHYFSSTELANVFFRRTVFRWFRCQLNLLSSRTNFIFAKSIKVFQSVKSIKFLPNQSKYFNQSNQSNFHQINQSISISHCHN